MQTINAGSTQVISEEWAVVVGKEVFYLNEKQIQLLKKADLSGQRGILWFDEFAISIPHIQSIYLTSKRYQKPLEISAGETKEYTEEQIQKNRERIANIKKGIWGGRND